MQPRPDSKDCLRVRGFSFKDYSSNAMVGFASLPSNAMVDLLRYLGEAARHRRIDRDARTRGGGDGDLLQVTALE